MDITFAPRGILQIDDARIVYRNFAGEASAYNREGDRNFAVVIETEEQAEALKAEGWNVKYKPSRSDPDDIFRYLPVKIKFNDRGPIIYMVMGDQEVRLTEENVKVLDKADISRVDLDIRPYDWEVNKKTGRSAYLSAMRVTNNVSRFELAHLQRAADEGDMPF